MNHTELKKIAKGKLHLNFIGIIIIPIISLLITDLIYPLIGGISFIQYIKYYYIYQDLDYLIGFGLSPFRLLMAGIISYLIGVLFEYWKVNYHMSIHINDGKKVMPWNVFDDMTFDGFLTYVSKYLVMSIFVALWGLLFIIPGIIKGFSYALVPYIAIERPELGIMETLKESERLMKGHRMELFILNLSFILWHILNSITLNILSIYIDPYISLTVVGFYYERKRQDELDLSIYTSQYFDENII